MGDNKNALDFHLLALKRFEEVGNEKGQSFCMQGIGGDLLRFDRFREAFPYLQKSMKMKQALGDKRGMASAALSIGQGV